MWQIIVQIVELQKWCNKDAKINIKRSDRSLARSMKIENCVRTQKNGNKFSWKNFNLHPVVQFFESVGDISFQFMTNCCPDGKYEQIIYCGW